MKFTVLAVVAMVMALALLAALPCASEAQSASIQASVTVLEPTAQPAVRLEASETTEGAAAVVVEGTESWAVSVEVGEEGFELAAERGGAGRLELSAAEWAKVAQAAGSSPVPVRVVLAAH